MSLTISSGSAHMILPNTEHNLAQKNMRSSSKTWTFTSWNSWTATRSSMTTNTKHWLTPNSKRKLSALLTSIATTSQKGTKSTYRPTFITESCSGLTHVPTSVIHSAVSSQMAMCARTTSSLSPARTCQLHGSWVVSWFNAPSNTTNSETVAHISKYTSQMTPKSSTRRKFARRTWVASTPNTFPRKICVQVATNSGLWSAPATERSCSTWSLSSRAIQAARTSKSTISTCATTNITPLRRTP